jgi:hypothetical protein
MPLYPPRCPSWSWWCPNLGSSGLIQTLRPWSDSAALSTHSAKVSLNLRRIMSFTIKLLTVACTVSRVTPLLWMFSWRVIYQSISVIDDSRSMTDDSRSMTDDSRIMTDDSRSIINNSRSIINNSRSIIVAPLTDDSRGIIYYRNILLCILSKSDRPHCIGKYLLK